MATRRVVWGSLVGLALMLFLVPPDRADTISGSATAGWQDWTVQNLKNNGKPFWDNKSLDSKNKKVDKKSNVGFYLTDETIPPTTALDDGPDDSLPYWGKPLKKSKKKTGGNADLNFYFDRTELADSAVLQLEASPNANIDEFGWYDIADPSVLHPIFGGSDSPITNATFSPSLEYGFYLKRDNDNETFYTQSELNPYKDTLHQHFVVFEESLTPSNDVYWIGIEDSTRLELKGKEGGLGDYNDMLIEIGVSSPAIVPEPSTIMLVLTGTLLLVGIRYRNRR